MVKAMQDTKLSNDELEAFIIQVFQKEGHRLSQKVIWDKMYERVTKKYYTFKKIIRPKDFEDTLDKIAFKVGENNWEFDDDA